MMAVCKPVGFLRPFQITFRKRMARDEKPVSTGAPDRKCIGKRIIAGQTRARRF
jgi:hypothetical protein